MVSEQAAALTYLSSRDDVDSERIGAFGISLGSTLAYWHAALDLRLRAIAHLCCYADYATLVELGAHDNHGIYLLVPGMLRHTSTGEIAGMVAPRPQLICLGDEDELTPPLSIERALAVTRPMYERAGAPEALEVFIQAGVDHRETPEMHEKVMAFFQRELRPEDVKYAIVGAGIAARDVSRRPGRARDRPVDRARGDVRHQCGRDWRFPRRASPTGPETAWASTAPMTSTG